MIKIKQASFECKGKAASVFLLIHTHSPAKKTPTVKDNSTMWIISAW